MKYVTISLLVIIVLSSCDLLSPGADENADMESSAGSLVYDGNTYPIDAGNIENYQDPSSPFNLAIYLMGTGLGFDTGTSSFTGTGDIVIFDLYSSTDGDLAEGTYSWSTGNEAGTLASVEFYLNYNTDTSTFDTYVSGDSGSVTISKTGSTYSIDFTVLDGLDNEIASGSFEGELPIWTD